MPRMSVDDAGPVDQRDRASALRSLAASVRVSLQSELGEREAYACFMGMVKARFLEANGYVADGFQSPGFETVAGRLPQPTDAGLVGRVREVLTDEVCRDVEVVGWLHQAYLSERKAAVFAGFKERRKAGPGEIPVATQLFTPHWIVRYLVENSLGRLWLLNHPESLLAEQMDYYVEAVAEDPEFVRVGSPEELRVIDPACGSGHLLTYAFDLLHAIYSEAGYDPAEIPRLILTHNLYGVEIDPDVGSLASFALTVKARERGFVGAVEPNICVLRPVSFTSAELKGLGAAGLGDASFWNQFEHADTFGSLIRPQASRQARRPGLGAGVGAETDLAERAELVLAQAEYLTREHHVVVANPPYMGSKNMSDLLSARLRAEQSNGKVDLYAAFVERAMSLSLPGALVGMITMQGWMFLDSYRELREKVRERWSVVTLSHLGPSAFDDVRGQVVSTSAFVLRNAPSDRPGSYVRLVDVPRDDKGRVAVAAYRGEAPERRFDLDVHALGALPGGEFAYWLTPTLLRAFADLPPISARVDTRSGMATGDNDRFLRYWWEVRYDDIGLGLSSAAESVAAGVTWVPYNKGGRSNRWFGNNDHVVQWRDDGELIKATKVDDLAAGRITTNNARCWNQDRYFQPAVTWSAIGAGRLGTRFADVGSIFDTKGQSLFVDDEDDRLYYLALLNSGTASRLLQALTPALDFNSGPIGRLPDPYATADRARVAALAREAVELQRRAWDESETSWAFAEPSSARLPTRSARLETLLAEDHERRRGETERLRQLELEIDACVAAAYGDSTPVDPPPVTDLTKTPAAAARDLVSYGVGCVFGRFESAVAPVEDNVIPLGQAASLLRRFLAATYGDEHVEENVGFLSASLGVTDLERYLARDFYNDHVMRYRKRPIYWLFSSPRGSFQALVSMHRYTPETVSAVRSHLAKARAGASGRLRDELTAYDRSVLAPLERKQVVVDLDDGVKASYAKFGTALKKVRGLSS